VTKRNLLLCICLILLYAPAMCSGAEFRAGVAKADITPPPGLPMYGYLDRIADKHLSTGMLDPLEARVLVLEVGDQRVALVALDLGRCFGKASFDKMQAEVQRRSGISLLVMSASHTHSGPDILDDYPNGRTPAWETAALVKIADAVDSAVHSLVKARLGVGYGSTYVGYNRRVVNSDGSVTMLWQNPEKTPTSPVDPTVSVLRVDTEDSKPLAILVNYACHPVIFGPDNLQYSADYVGVMRNAVEKAFNGQPLCLFFQGGDGDINPYYATTPLAQGAIQRRDWTGQHLAEEVIHTAQRIQPADVASPSLDFARDEMQVPLRWPAQQFRDELLRKFGPVVFEDHADILRDKPLASLSMRVNTLLINKQIAMVGLPGEPFVDFQLDFRNRCPVPNAFLLGYTNGYFDYFPTIKAAAEGGYGAGDSDTYVAVGTGELMINHALLHLEDMLGRLKELPNDLKTH
jgi:Neutral/alkaline non-lysosomal ceramidase, N-terminal